MPQTMMSFAAMMIAALAAFNQMTSQLQTYDEMIRGEYELMANAVVLERMEIIDLTTDYEDLEDWNGTTTTAAFEAGGVSVSFDLAISVQYVDEDGLPSEAETDQKEVVIEATQEKFLMTLVNHRRLFSE